MTRKEIIIYYQSIVVTPALLASFCDACFRLATLADIPQLMAIEKRAFDATRYDGLNTKQSLHHLITRGNSLIIVDDAVQGYAQLHFRRSSRVVRLYSLAVTPEAQGSGLGRALVGACERLCRGINAHALTLEYRADNDAMRGFYARRGYSVYRTVPAYYPDGMAAEKVILNAI